MWQLVDCTAFYLLASPQYYSRVAVVLELSQFAAQLLVSDWELGRPGYEVVARCLAIGGLQAGVFEGRHCERRA